MVILYSGKFQKSLHASPGMVVGRHRVYSIYTVFHNWPTGPVIPHLQYGRFSIPLALEGYEMHGLDLTPSFIDEARRNALNHNLNWDKKLATPANWKDGDSGVMGAPNTVEASYQREKEGAERWYLKKVS